MEQPAELVNAPEPPSPPPEGEGLKNIDLVNRFDYKKRSIENYKTKIKQGKTVDSDDFRKFDSRWRYDPETDLWYAKEG